MNTRGKSSRRVRGATVEVVEAARRLRRSLTPAEEVLWQALRGGQLAGLRFRRQHPVGTFVLDFYCATFKLVVELDGGVHDGQVEEDAARTQRLSEYGYRVLRFRNEEVLGDMGSVLERILRAADGALTPVSPLPILGEGRADRLSPRPAREVPLPQHWGRGQERGPSSDA